MMEEVLKGKKVLVVEDEEMNWLLIRDILDIYDAECTWAEIGQKAIDLVLQGNNYDAVLMDINMPTMNGFEVTRRLKEINPDLPIMAQTAFAMDEEIRKCYEAGCSLHICKPYSVSELGNQLSKLFNL
jgi:two-component system, cell cycle response regulator DivK